MKLENAMKLMACTILALCALVTSAAAKDSRFGNARETRRGQPVTLDSPRPYSKMRDVAHSLSLSSAESRPALKDLPYKNILNAGKWSRMLKGRALTARLKKNSHAPQEGDEMFIILEYGGCNWGCCFKQCMSSAMSGTGTLCTVNCTGCGLTGSLFPCAVCGACGAVGFAAIEFCSLHCCVDPGC